MLQNSTWSGCRSFGVAGVGGLQRAGLVRGELSSLIAMPRTGSAAADPFAYDDRSCASTWFDRRLTSPAGSRAVPDMKSRSLTFTDGWPAAFRMGRWRSLKRRRQCRGRPGWPPVMKRLSGRAADAPTGGPFRPPALARTASSRRSSPQRLRRPAPSSVRPSRRDRPPPQLPLRGLFDPGRGRFQHRLGAPAARGGIRTFSGSLRSRPAAGPAEGGEGKGDRATGLLA